MPAADRSITESALRRDRWIVIGGLAAITLLSWLYIVSGAGTGMSAWNMTAASLFPHRAAELQTGGDMPMEGPMEGMPMDGMPMGGMTQPPASWTPGYWIIMLLMWWIMMVAMMTPSAAPMILLYAGVTRHAQAHGRLQPGTVPTAAFAGGYLLAWLAFSLGATILMWAFDQSGLISAATMASRSAWLSGGILIAAGLYQLSPLKRICLRRCRHPAEFLSRHWRPGSAGALRMGIEHGVFCVGCCWILMALLFVGGIMNVLWIGILALFVIIEKLAPHGARWGWIGGAVLIAWGVATLYV
jgi:predicted metal-binding membrane protein